MRAQGEKMMIAIAQTGFWYTWKCSWIKIHAKLERWKAFLAFDIAFRCYLLQKKKPHTLLECQNMQRISKLMCSADKKINLHSL